MMSAQSLIFFFVLCVLDTVVMIHSYYIYYIGEIFYVVSKFNN